MQSTAWFFGRQPAGPKSRRCAAWPWAPRAPVLHLLLLCGHLQQRQSAGLLSGKRIRPDSKHTGKRVFRLCRLRLAHRAGPGERHGQRPWPSAVPSSRRSRARLAACQAELAAAKASHAGGLRAPAGASYLDYEAYVRPTTPTSPASPPTPGRRKPPPARQFSPATPFPARPSLPLPRLKNTAALALSRRRCRQPAAGAKPPPFGWSSPRRSAGRSPRPRPAANFPPKPFRPGAPWCSFTARSPAAPPPQTIFSRRWTRFWAPPRA